MQLLLVVLAVHLMCVVAGPGRASAAPALQPNPGASATPSRPFHRHPSPGVGGGNNRKSRASSALTPWNPDNLGRSERSSGMWDTVHHKKFLTSKNGYTLEIFQDGTVNTSRFLRPKFGILQTEGARSVNGSSLYGKITIMGFHSDRYLCMGKNGNVYTRSREDQLNNYSMECVWQENMKVNFYNTFCSYKFPKNKYWPNGTERGMWCLGINEYGEIRKGKKTNETDKLAYFTTRKVDEPPTPFPNPVTEVTPVPPPGPKPTESRNNNKKRRRRKKIRRRQRQRERRRQQEQQRRGCKGAAGLFNLKCRDNGDVITDVSELKRTSSRRRGKNRRKDRRKTSHIKTTGLFHHG